MALISLVNILNKAKAGRYGVGMFDVMNGDMIQAVISAAEQERSPAILAFAEVHKSYQNLKQFSRQLINAAEEASVPVCVHCDHGTSYDFIVQCIVNGFSSVMFDGSTLPYDENVAQTAEIVRIAHAAGCNVEGELGHVGSAEGGGDDGHGDMYTDPLLVADFVSRTNVDALAVAIGTAHGVYKKTPKLDLELLSTISAISPAYLVLHGGSGLTDDDFANCIRHGITKINIWTDLVLAATNYVTNNCAMNKAYTDLSKGTIQAVCEEARGKMRIFGSSGKA